MGRASDFWCVELLYSMDLTRSGVLAAHVRGFTGAFLPTIFERNAISTSFSEN